MSCCPPRNTNAEVRAVTRRFSSFVSALMISSARPSLKYSFSLSELRFRNGSTAIDGSPAPQRPLPDARRDTASCPDAAGEIDLLERVFHLGHRLVALVRILLAGTAHTTSCTSAGASTPVREIGRGSSRSTAVSVARPDLP